MTVQFTTRALKDVRGLPADEAERILAGFDRLTGLDHAAGLPRQAAGVGVNVKQLRGGDGFRLRAGDYRAGFSVEGDLLTVEWVRDRKAAYD